RPTLVILPTPDAAERAYADVLCYLGEADARKLHLHRGHEAAFGSIEAPSERSARMTLLAALDAGESLLVLTSVAALRSYTMPRSLLHELRTPLRVGDEAGWEPTIRHLHRLGYERTDIVSAVGQFAVRGGILDCYAATAEAPTRIEFFGETIESIRTFDLESQRSIGTLDAIEIVPWSEIPRDPEYRERLAARIKGDAARIRTLENFLERGEEIPDAWLAFAHEEPATLLDYLPESALLTLVEPAMLVAIERALDEERIRERSTLLAHAAAEELDVRDEFVDEALLAEIEAPHPRLDSLEAASARLQCLLLPGAIEGEAPSWLPRINASYVVPTLPSDHYNRQIPLFIEAMEKAVAQRESVLILTTGVARVSEILGTLAGQNITVEHGSLDAGFTLPELRLRVLGDREIFGAPPKRVKLRAVKEGVPVTLADLKVGDYVVHAVHGIGQYVGLRSETHFGATQDFLDLHYAGSDRMMVPITQMHQVTKYSAGDGGNPRLSKMGGVEWARTKARVGSQLAAIADGLVELYAEREMSRGYRFSPDSEWQRELEEAFAYEPTPDQATAISAVKADMERERPMDRVVCGDVGYGKTEVALRAAFKAVSDKKQVAILVPTTLLAAQHYRTFTARFASYPLRIEELSRFKTKAEQRATLAGLAEGKVDIVIGTHRLLQKDIVFADLGLIVVDEEQRFGVMHKERLKELKTSVDVLTLSATPIPRTLHMSLMGVRDLSLIQTAPKNRMSIKTVVLPGSDAVVARAIASELDRGGQIYYLHNRVESIYAVANAL
ncbi:MAG TPA: DEAD/DEAH box helicase, partial [Candidatus Dormibacteraeota bacterium]|nr:DEAD/DEAH box helicase [Candidatus Dormibacteraeota bacterium]